MKREYWSNVLCRRATIRNDFHGTETSTWYCAADREKIEHGVASGRITSRDKEYRAMKRAWKALCGHKDCKCSNAWGIRGPQEEEPLW